MSIFSPTSSLRTILIKVCAMSSQFFFVSKINRTFCLGWMAKTFFTGGTMPSHDLLLHFQEDLQLVERWVVNGQHYSKTLEAWLKKLDANIKEIWPILETTYGNSSLTAYRGTLLLHFNRIARFENYF